jgi:hypothetical protein
MSAKRLLLRLLAVLAAALAALAVPMAPALAEDDPPVIYRVKPGDTLYSISRKFLRSAAVVPQLQRLNQVRNPRRLPVGKPLRVPRHLLRYRPVELRVAAFSGPVQLAGRAAMVGMLLDEGEAVTTGRSGFISLRASTGADFSIPSNSSARLIRARQYVLGDIVDVDFAVEGGRGEVTSPALKQQDRLRLRTPVATTAVRGTQYRMAFDPVAALSLTEVIEGSVAIAAGAQERTTAAGFGVASTAAGIGPEEALLRAIEVANRGKVQTEEALSFELVPAAAARGYRVQIARDAGFLDTLGEIVTAEPRASLEGIADGRYFVRARGIAASGLEGNSTAYSFRRKRLGVTGSAERSAITDGYLFKWVSVGAGENAFAFQLWDEREPERLLVDETGLTDTALVLTALAPGSYRWRVAVMQADEDGLLKVWSEPQSLVVSN